MYFKFPCTSCGQTLTARDEHVGRRVVCPYCRTTVAIEKPQGQEQESSADALAQLKTSAVSGSSRRPKSAAASSGGAAGTEWIDGTNVSMVWSGLAGLAAAGLFFALLTPLFLAGNFFGKLFIKQDASLWVPFATVFLACWAVAMLVLKSRKLARQRQSMLFDLLPNEIGEEINERNVDQFIAAIDKLPGNQRESFLINRVKRGLEHFRVRKNASEVATQLASQSDIDGNAVESSYTLLNVFIWAIPILGFIGTVIGISAAVGGFQGNLAGAGEMSELKESLGSVTGGLATAFDTTLIALVLSMFVMFPTHSMKKAEEDLLNWVDEYCNENLLKRLNDGRDESPTRRDNSKSNGGVTSTELQQAINTALAEHHAELQTWRRKLELIGTTLTNQVSEGLLSVREQEQEAYDRRLGQIDDLHEMTKTLHESARSLGAYCDNLNQGLAALNEVLEKLDGRQVVVKVEKPKRRTWFFG